MRFFLAQSLLGSLVCFTATALAADGLSSAEPNFEGKKHYRTSIRHIEGGGIGYNQGYTTLEAFLALDPSRSSVIPFIDVRGHVFDGGRFATNAGAGVRVLSGCRVYGINTYYDYRSTNRQHYNQFGMGLETLGVRWDFRVNGYLPVGDRTSHLYDTKATITAPTFNSFQGNEALMSQTLTVSRKKQYAMKGLDSEIAFHILKNEHIDLYAGAGPYYYNYSSKQALGVQARIGAQIYEHLSLEVINSYDSRFKENIQGSVGLNIPFGPRPRISKNKRLSKCSDPALLAQRLVQDVKRQEIIVLDKTLKTKTSEVFSSAIDPLTEKPYFFVFVDNTSNSQGTYESPYPTLALAEANSSPGDIIYVFPGDGSTNGMNAGISLQDNQWFWGSDVNLPLQTTLGSIIVPAFGTAKPLITNTTGSCVILASDNRVVGFAITETAENGIIGFDPGTVEISLCTIDQSLSDQIHLEYTVSTGTITLDNLTLTNGAVNGIFIDSSTSLMTCMLSNCIIEDSVLRSVDISLAEGATVTLKNNTIQDNVDSCRVDLTGSSTVVVSGNTFKNTTSVSEVPLLISAGASPLSVTVENNTITHNEHGAINFILRDTELANITISGNTISDNDTGSGGVLYGSAILINPDSSDLGNCHLVLKDNVILANMGDAFAFTGGSFDDLQVTATGNEIIGNGAGFIVNTSCNTLTLTAVNNTISAGRDHGIAVLSPIIDTATLALSDNRITVNTFGASGVAIAHAGTDLSISMINNDISRNDGSGMVIYSSGVIDNITTTIENNTINGNRNSGSNAAAGVSLDTFTNLLGTFLNNTLLNNTGLALGVGVFSTSPQSTCLAMSGNNTNTDYALINPGGTFNLTPCDVVAVNTGTITMTGVTIIQSCPDGDVCP